MTSQHFQSMREWQLDQVFFCYVFPFLFFGCQVEESLEGMPIQFGQAGILDSVHLFSMKEVR